MRELCRHLRLFYLFRLLTRSYLFVPIFMLFQADRGLTFFERLHARLEYEKIDSDVIDDADAIWLSGAWRF